MVSLHVLAASYPGSRWEPGYEASVLVASYPGSRWEPGYEASVLAD